MKPSDKILLFATLLGVFITPVLGVQPTKEEYELFSLLENALLNDNASETGLAPNLYILAETFYPKQQPQPICVPIKYNIFFEGCLNCTEPDYNASFLWTEYDVGVPIGSFLLSYSHNGIVLKGFDWEEACLYIDYVELRLDVETDNISNETLFHDALNDLTSLLKGYAAVQGVPDVHDTNYRAYAISWTDKERDRRATDNRLVLLVELVILSIFIIFLSLAMTTYSYDTLYNNVKGKKNPGYPVFWSITVVSFCWNIVPSWIVLTRYSYQVYISLVVVIVLQFFVAFIVPKKSDFPIPCLHRHRCTRHPGKVFTFRKVAWTCFRCLLNHIVQILALWSILISLTFVIYYLSAIIVSFYLSPTQTLVKVVFLKAVAVCTILNVALVFSISRFKFKFSWQALKEDVTSFITLIAVLTFLPILGFLAFVIGGILFSQSSQNSGLQGILTLIPSGFLLIVAWVSRGTLFPEGIHNADPEKEIVSDLEKGATHHDDTPPAKKKSDTESFARDRRLNSHPLANVQIEEQNKGYNSEDSHGGTLGPTSGETKPLIRS